MRTSSVAFAVMLFAVSGFAQEKGTTAPPPGSFRMSVFASDLSYTESRGDSDLPGGVGLSLEYRLREKWSAELSYTFEKKHEFATVTTYFPDGTILYDTRRIDVERHPVDLVGMYHFSNSTRWKPYVGLGARYAVRERGFSNEYKVYGQVVGGVNFQFTDELSLRLGAKQLLHSDSYQLFDTSVGLGWRF